jgi:nucleoside-diphosphate-sugar epimerase
MKHYECQFSNKLNLCQRMFFFSVRHFEMRPLLFMNYLIVGQGIAGTNLTFTLLERGNSVTIADNPQEFSSSKVAAGLFNPITGRKMSKTWLADSLFAQFLPKIRAETEG